MAEKSRLDTLMNRLRLDLVRKQPAELSPEFVVAALEEIQKRVEAQDQLIAEINNRPIRGPLKIG